MVEPVVLRSGLEVIKRQWKMTPRVLAWEASGQWNYLWEEKKIDLGAGLGKDGMSHLGSGIMEDGRKVVNYEFEIKRYSD